MKSVGWVCLAMLCSVGCGGSSIAPGTSALTFDLGGTHYALTNAYYSVAGTTPLTSYWVRLSDEPCGGTQATTLTLHAYPFSVGGSMQPLRGDASLLGPSTPAGSVNVSGTLALDQDVPQLTGDYAALMKAAAMLNAPFDGTVSLQASGSGATTSVSAAFNASHCATMDNL